MSPVRTPHPTVTGTPAMDRLVAGIDAVVRSRDAAVPASVVTGSTGITVGTSG